MSYPKFYDKIETIKVKDSLSNILGTFENGEYEFCYLDVVKSIGLSCPIVIGAYLITLEALKILYPSGLALRGGIQVEFKDDLEDDMTGIIATIISQITGATSKGGFKGLNGDFSRHSLMFYDSDIDSSVRFTRLEDFKSVDIFYNLSFITPTSKMLSLLQKVMQGDSTSKEFKEFGRIWQEKVENISKNIKNIIKVKEL